MAFQPFGYPFEVQSQLSLAAAKAAIRSKKKPWFESKNGARGWIVGPFLCLWASAFDQSGPMVLARLEQDGFGTHVKGRAGSDLNGIMLMALLCAGMVFLLAQMFRENGGSFTAILPLAGFMTAVAALVFWMAHRSRRDADGLVRFLRQTLGEMATPAPLRRRNLSAIRSPVTITTDGESFEDVTTAEPLYDLVEQLSREEIDFILLQRADEEYMQTGCSYGRFALEIRKGSEDRHFHAVLPFTDGERRPDRAAIIESLLCYVEGREDSAPVTWRPGHDTSI